MQDYDKCGSKDENLCVDVDIDDVNLGEQNTQLEHSVDYMYHYL